MFEMFFESGIMNCYESENNLLCSKVHGLDVANTAITVANWSNILDDMSASEGISQLFT